MSEAVSYKNNKDSDVLVNMQEGLEEGKVERKITKLPSDAFLWAAGLSIGTSLLLQLTSNRHRSLFVGQWAPTFLILGLYQKLTKELN